jgi:crotonobetainyl-CoA:carnitine CoA-transferase CaiB-like acyl-CoA transferase
VKHGLKKIRVIDFSSEIAGPYATKLFADAGADVIKVESPLGDSLRGWSASGADLSETDGAFFQFLNTSKRSVVGHPGDPEILELCAGADLVVEDFTPGIIDEFDLCERFPGLVLLSITPFGRGGPYSERPFTEFTIQAESGSIAGRGLPSQPPIMAGGRISEWVSGTFAAVAGLAAVQRAGRTGQGEHVDFSMLEVMNIAGTVYGDLMASLAGRPVVEGPSRSVEVPSIEPTLDGWVGFNTNSRQQYNDFLVLIERTDLLEDEELASIAGRTKRIDEWNEIVRSWTSRHTTAEIVERASLLRIPVAPVNDGEKVFDHPQLKERGVFVKNPTGGFLQPRSPYLMNGEGPRPFEPVPKLGEHTGKIEARRRKRKGTSPSAANNPELPLAGIRVLDATAWWAGPSSTHMLATLGAEVIHLEAIQRMDGMRMLGGMFFSKPQWWEYSAIYLSANSNKKGLTLDLSQAEGIEVAKKLIAECDIFVENYSPRVVENFGLDWDTVHALNPRTIMVRMPAFGLSGPWRDNVGFAQTMEQMTGLAWLTGHADDQPRIQRGPCDPLAGMHSAYAALVALAEREVTGEGALLECTMVEGALNAAAEQLVEWSAYGAVLQRDGNRAPYAAPQGLYPCAGSENWLALSIATDAQWQAFALYLGSPEWATAAGLATHQGRAAAHDKIDEAIVRLTADRDISQIVSELVERGIPAAPVCLGGNASTHPQLAARGFFEQCDHPVIGTHPLVTVPFRFASRSEPWLHSPAPVLGQDNRAILSRIVGLTDSEIDALEASEVIGTHPKGL